jgi:hypothetical protein
VGRCQQKKYCDNVSYSVVKEQKCYELNIFNGTTLPILSKSESLCSRYRSCSIAVCAIRQSMVLFIVMPFFLQLYMTTYIIAHKIRLSKRLSCRLVRHPSGKKDSRQAGMTQYAQKLMTLCIVTFSLNCNYLSISLKEV